MIRRRQVTAPARQQGIQAPRQGLGLYGRAGKGHSALPRDDVVGNAGTGSNQLHRIDIRKALRQQFQGIAELVMDLDAGVAAGETLHFQAPVRQVGGGLQRVAPGEDPAAAPGAANVQFVPVLGVQVQHHLAAEQTGIQPQGAAEAGFLVHGKQQLQRRVLDISIGHHRQRRGTADAVVRTERGLVRQQPAVLDLQAQGVGKEIVNLVAGLHRHHVQVVLDDYRAVVLAPG